MRQVLRAGALGRPRGMGWGGKWEGGSGWGTHVNPWLIHVNVREKPLQYCKVISLQLIKINEKITKNFFNETASSALASGFFPTEPPGKPCQLLIVTKTTKTQTAPQETRVSAVTLSEELCHHHMFMKTI